VKMDECIQAKIISAFEKMMMSRQITTITSSLMNCATLNAEKLSVGR